MSLQTATNQRSTQPLSPNVLRRQALDAIAEAMHAYLALRIGEVRPAPRFVDLTSTQRSRLVAAAMIGVESINVPKFLAESAVAGVGTDTGSRGGLDG